MKNLILVLIAFMFLTATVLIGCDNSAEKLQDAQKEVMESNKDLDQANEEYLKDIEKYQQEAAKKIEANYLQIANFRVKIGKKRKEIKADYGSQIDDMEQRNNDLRNRMNDYKQDGRKNWETFKTELNYDMSEMEKVFKNMAVNDIN